MAFKICYGILLSLVLLMGCQTTSGPDSPNVISSGKTSRTGNATSTKSLPENVGQLVIYRDGALALLRSPDLYVDAQPYGICRYGAYTTISMRPGTYRLNVGTESVDVEIKDGEQTFAKCGVWRSILDSNNFGFVDVINREVASDEVSSLSLFMSYDVAQENVKSSKLTQVDEQENVSTASSLIEASQAKPETSYPQTTIASASYKDFPHNQLLSYVFIDRNKYMKRNNCWLHEDSSEELKRIYNCVVTDDRPVIPAMVCRDKYLKSGQPIFILTEDLLTGLEKALEWAEINKSAKVKFTKSLPPEHDTNLSFSGFEYGGALVFIAGCPAEIHEVAKFIVEIKDNLDSAYKKSLGTDVDKLFN